MKNKTLSLVYLHPDVLKDTSYKFLHDLELFHPGSLKEGQAVLFCFDVDTIHNTYIEVTVVKPEKKHIKVHLPHTLVIAILEVVSHKNQFGIPLESVVPHEQLEGL